jgi:hypothetical protein
MVQQGFADPIGFSASRRARDQPGLLHGERLKSAPQNQAGMGIILIMAV